MKILVCNIQKSNGYYSYLQSLLSDLIPPKDIFIKEVLSKPFSFFQKLQLQQFIKKEGIECFMQLTEKKVISSSLPQLIVPFEVEKLLIKKPLPLTAKLGVSSLYEKEIITTRYPFLQENVYIIRASASSPFQPISWSEKQAVKLEYTQGREYFITQGKGLSEEAFTSLLKAFSSFKKWQHSGMKLVITGKLSFGQNDEWKEKMKSYKYRDDVVMMNETFSSDTYPSLLAGAYAFLHLPIQHNDVVPVLEAMQCETPCISFTSDVLKEYSGEAVLFIEKDKYDLLSEAMITLYKDEEKRSLLIEEGRKQAQHYTRKKALQSLAAVLPAGIINESSKKE